MVESKIQLQKFFQFFMRGFQILRRSLERFGEQRAGEAAAGMAFYGFFSMFPLLLLLVTFGGTFLESSEAQTQVLDFLVGIFPISGNVIERNIQQVLQSRGSVRSFSVIALAWSGSAIFAILARNIGFAWTSAKRRHFLIRRLIALLILVVLVALMFMLMTANTLTRFIPKELNGAAQVLMQMRFFSQFAVWVSLFVSLLTLYRWIPNTFVSWAEGAWGSLVASTAIVVTTFGFTWYIRNGFINYSLVYGSLGAVAALLFWTYLLAFWVLFGAYLSAAISEHQRLGDNESSDTSIYEQ